MRIFLPLSVLMLATSATAAPPSAAPASPLAPPAIWNRSAPLDQPIRTELGATKVCHGRLETANATGRLEKLDGEAKGEDEPLLIAAVDRLIDGCEVLVVRNDTGEIRPLPKFSDGPATLKPAH